MWRTALRNLALLVAISRVSQSFANSVRWLLEKQEFLKPIRRFSNSMESQEVSTILINLSALVVEISRIISTTLINLPIFFDWKETLIYKNWLYILFYLPLYRYKLSLIQKKIVVVMRKTIDEVKIELFSTPKQDAFGLISKEEQ